METLTKREARLLLLHAQGLAEAPPKAPTAHDLLETIRRMGVLQIDTIHVVARSPYLVLWSRLGQYEPVLLEQVHAEGKLFEYWSHAACFIPIEDYAYYRRFMLDRAKGYVGIWKWIEANPELPAQILEHIAKSGPVRSSEFERADGRKGSWWDWKQEKVALECLHTSGELMIQKRERFQRVYDLRERVHPSWSDKNTASREEAVKRLTEKAVKSLGAPQQKWVHDYFRLKRDDTTKALDSLLGEGRVVEANIEEMPGRWLIHSDHLADLKAIRKGEIEAERTVLLSPFDPIVWDRVRATELFDFDYTIECYVPEAKRQYGYFVLPILHRDRLVGRLDAKAHRKDKLFEVKAIFLEPGVDPSDELISAIGKAINACAHWHHTPKVQVRTSTPKGLARNIQAEANRRR